MSAIQELVQSPYKHLHKRSKEMVESGLENSCTGILKITHPADKSDVIIDCLELERK